MPDVDVVTYFRQNSRFERRTTSFAANAIERSGVRTMRQLADKSDDEIKHIRNLGPKCLPTAIAMREKYRREKS